MKNLIVVVAVLLGGLLVADNASAQFGGFNPFFSQQRIVVQQQPGLFGSIGNIIDISRNRNRGVQSLRQQSVFFGNGFARQQNIRVVEVPQLRQQRVVRVNQPQRVVVNRNQQRVQRVVVNNGHNQQRVQRVVVNQPQCINNQCRQ